MNRYPRDMQGYGENTPDPKWPNNAKIAVQFVVNYEEGGENCVLHGDQASEAFLSEIIGASAWQGQRHWNMESIYEYGARVGFWRVYRLFQEMDIKATVYGVATALARSPEQVEAMQKANWEIASHGLKWVEYKDYKFKDERQDMREAIRIHKEITGARPMGWYTGRCSENTVAMAAEEGGFAYVSDSYADDLPYWIKCSGNDQLVIPYTLDVNDMRFATPQGFNASEQFYCYLKDSFDTLYAEGQTGHAKMMSVGLHCRLIGRPGRITALRRFMEYAKSHKDVWFPRRIDIANHWAEYHPSKTKLCVSQMSLPEFVDTFGGVFEHSKWIAEKAYGSELSPAHNGPIGIHSALSRVFRSADRDTRLKVLNAHPDLAGKLAPAGKLTDASKSEQSGAGLDYLTDDERGLFSSLNKTYMEKHGFPFIIAVRDHTKDSIKSVFQARINNNKETEFDEACLQVERIAELRIAEIFAA